MKSLFVSYLFFKYVLFLLLIYRKSLCILDFNLAYTLTNPFLQSVGCLHILKKVLLEMIPNLQKKVAKIKIVQRTSVYAFYSYSPVIKHSAPFVLSSVCTHACTLSLCVYTFVCICLYIYMHTYINIHTHTHIFSRNHMRVIIYIMALYPYISQCVFPKARDIPLYPCSTITNYN